MIRAISLGIGGLFVLLGIGAAVVWTTFRIYVPPNMCAILIAKSGDPLGPNQKIAEPGQKGIQREALGPGRYFYNPIFWDWELVDLTEIPAGDPHTWKEVYRSGDPSYRVPDMVGSWPQVGVVTSLAGKAWDQATEVVDPGFQGIQREVLTPGTYRLNPRAFKVELKPAVVVPLGCAGVVTSQLGESPGYETVQATVFGPDGELVKGEERRTPRLAQDGERGVLEQILQPGIYYINPYVYKVTIVQIGYNELSQLRSQNVRDNIRFPSRDGFTIEVGVTVVWGRHPDSAPEMIARFGDVEKIREIVLGQIRSIARNIGSEYDSTDFIRGEKREQYQQAVTETLQRVAKERDIEILIALIQNFEVISSSTNEEMDLKTTIQRGYIAKEEELTRQAQRETAVVRADLETAKAEIEVAREQIRGETRKKVAQILAEGQKQAQEIDAQRDLAVAEIEREIAKLEAERTLLLGRAEAEVERMKNQADADGRRMLVEAFGTGRAYNLFTFAEDFAPANIQLIFAGQGTFWTDLNRTQDVSGLRLLEDLQRREDAQRGAAAVP